MEALKVAPLCEFLLNAYTWVWFISGSRQLGSKAIKIIESRRTELFLSSISTWEVLLLGERGRLLLRPTPEAWIEQALEILPLMDLPVSKAVAVMSRKIALLHEDPADRFIAATAACHEIHLLTSDETLLAAQGPFVAINARR